MDKTPFDHLLDAGWNPAKLSAALGDSMQSISNWKSRSSGIPPVKCKGIEALTGISVRVLRPADWHDYWPELVAA